MSVSIFTSASAVTNAPKTEHHRGNSEFDSTPCHKDRITLNFVRQIPSRLLTIHSVDLGEMYYGGMITDLHIPKDTIAVSTILDVTPFGNIFSPFVSTREFCGGGLILLGYLLWSVVSIERSSGNIFA
ncbi:hypothetical protein BBP40_006674 [Aspergillus hancockii]|nr:hypothetical protein BBP40_006674 [Aspergillus hancockii]